MAPGPGGPRFAVVGTGGSGTGFMAALLRACGVRCGHEQWWTPIGRRRVAGLAGDSSWLAVPDIEAGAWSGPVVHVTRDPVATVRNLVGGGVFSPAGHPRFVEFACAHEPGLTGVPPVEAAVEWWVRWNGRCAMVADLTVRIEDVPARLADIARVIGHRLHPGRAATVRPGVNHRRGGDVASAEVWRLLAGRAGRYGYGEV